MASKGHMNTATAENTLGYLAWAKDQSGEEHNSYDERGRLSWVIKRIATSSDNLSSFYTSQLYDSMDRITQLSYPDGTMINYDYNTRGLLESISEVIERIDYTPHGQKALLDLACGTSTSYEYDYRLRLKGLRTIRTSDGSVLQDLSYNFDGVSNITDILDNRKSEDIYKIGDEIGIGPTEAVKFSSTQSFLYDSLYRLIQAANPGIYGTINYRYDRVGNMVSQEALLIDPEPLMDLGAMAYGGAKGAWNRSGRAPGEPAGPHAFTSSNRGEDVGGLTCS